MWNFFSATFHQFHSFILILCTCNRVCVRMWVCFFFLFLCLYLNYNLFFASFFLLQFMLFFSLFFFTFSDHVNSVLYFDKLFRSLLRWWLAELALDGWAIVATHTHTLSEPFHLKGLWTMVKITTTPPPPPLPSYHCHWCQLQ